MTRDGLFVDTRSHWKGRIGQLAASFAKYEGGLLHIGPDGADVRIGLERVALCLAARVRLVCTSEPDSPDHGQSVLIRQENDPAPKFHFLEEGCVRLGMRVAFDLLDDEGHYHGDGRQDIWIYPEGDLHVTTSIQVVDRRGHGPIQDVYLEALGDPSFTQLRAGDQTVTDTGEISLPFGELLPEKTVFLSNSEEVVALYWARDQGHVWEVGSDHGPLPPFYASHWPTGMQQWARGGMGWTCRGESAGISASLSANGPTVDFSWLREGAVEVASEADATFSATLVVSLGKFAEELAPRITAVQQPLPPQVSGGTFRCYTEEDGTYEVGQGDPTGITVTFPPDPLSRTVRPRYSRRKTDPRHRGGIAATIDGQSAPFQLKSEGELTDDICVPMEMSHRNDSVDDVLLAARLSPDAPTEIRVDKLPGIQATYQSEITGVDLQRRAGNRRDIAVWSSRNPDAPALEFDLFSGAVHRLTDLGSTDPVVWEMPMAWFKSCGISQHHYCNCIKEFALEENGPDAVSLYTRSTNPNQRAQSETWLRIPCGHPRLRLEVRMRLKILEQWDDANVEFSDIFPYPSRLPETWFHDAVLFAQRGQTMIKYSYRPDTSFSTGGDSDDPRLFYALYPSARGNILTLIDNPQHPDRKLHYSVCGNYVDIHVNFNPGSVPVPAGEIFEINYVCELYGDGSTTVDELKQIGQRSLEAGDIIID